MLEYKQHKLSIIIPAYNEDKTIRRIIERVNRVDLGLDKEIIAVDDGSKDKTSEILDQIATAGKVDLKIFKHDKNQGKGAALNTGFKQASGDIIIIQDADLEYDPADYRSLIQPILDDKADIVYGSRFTGDKPHRVLYFWHYAGNKLIALISNIFSNLNLTDVETGYKAFRKEVIAGMKLKEKRFGFENEFTIKAARRKWRFYEVGISYAGRTYAEGKKLIAWRAGLRAAWCVVKYNIFS